MAADATKKTTIRKASQRTATSKGDSWHSAFLADLAENCNVSHAARLAGVDRSTAYRHREESAAFAAAWDDAVEDGIEALELSLRRRGMETSDTAAIFLLKAHRPEKYRDAVKVTGSGKNGEIEHAVAGEVKHSVDESTAGTIFDILASVGAIKSDVGDTEAE